MPLSCTLIQFIFLVASLHEVYIAIVIYSSMVSLFQWYSHIERKQFWDPQHCQNIFLLETHGALTLLTFFLLSP
uniref:Uncharacterized protein n=1 Tax=Brassica campestris TaxID=3711 RepID=A0A3P5ZR51_BRACM|nr:unnamed protein product [Brassica rapa]